MISEFYKNLGDKLNIDPELVKTIDDHIFYCLQEYMEDPENWGFLINKFIVFEPKLFKIKKYLENTSSLKQPSKIQLERLKKYKKIVELGEAHLKQQKKHGKARQTKETTNNE